MSDDRIVIFGYEIQHKLASEIWTSQTPEALAAAALLNSLGINPEATSNKIALLRTPATRDALLQSSTVKDILTRAGFGFNTQNSYNNPNAHPNYNAFEIDVLDRIANDSNLSSPQAKRYADSTDKMNQTIRDFAAITAETFETSTLFGKRIREELQAGKKRPDVPLDIKSVYLFNANFTGVDFSSADWEGAVSTKSILRTRYSLRPHVEECLFKEATGGKLDLLTPCSLLY